MDSPLERPLPAAGKHENGDSRNETATAETDLVVSEARKEIGRITDEVRSASVGALAERETPSERPWSEERLLKWLEKEVGITDPEKITAWRQRFDLSNKELVMHTGNLVLSDTRVTELPTGTQGIMIRNGNLILEGVPMTKLPTVVMKGRESHVNLQNSAIAELSEGSFFGDGNIDLGGSAIKKLPERIAFRDKERACFLLCSDQVELIKQCYERRFRYRIKEGGNFIFDSKRESLKNALPQPGLRTPKRNMYGDLR